MLKKILILSSFAYLFSFHLLAQVITIAEARNKAVGTTVRVTGIVTNGSELGGIRYFQDGTAGIAAYGWSELSGVSRGDSIVITGTLYDYNNLLEISPVDSVRVVSHGHALPAPVTLTPSQLSDKYEAQLVRIEDAVFADAGGTFAAKTNYTFTAGGEEGEIRINDSNSPLVGTVIPSGHVTIIGPLAQYKETYQILPRDGDDLQPGSSINIVTPVTVSNIQTTRFNLNWTTDTEGSTQVKWGYTPALEQGVFTAGGTGTDHITVVFGFNPSDLVYIQAFSVSTTHSDDTAKSRIMPVITRSESTGEIKVYFDRPVDTTVATGPKAVWLDKTLDDTLIAYIDRAKQTIDVAIYNFNNTGISNISTALNNAYNRGVQVRVVYDSNTDNSGINELAAGIGRIASPEEDYPNYGIMHNKFVIIDAHSSDPDDPIVWTGSTNFTEGQMYVDPNNVIIIQDQSLAIVYTMEFEEMFGSSGPQPDAGNSRFGPDKEDNTPHEICLGNGTRVECYFSPSDGTNGHILASINSADADLEAASMIITRSELGYAIRDRVQAGASGKVLVNDDSDPAMETVKKTLENALAENFRKTGENGIMHHKYLIADNSATDSDPLVLTGSHNWSSSAEYRNDENTLIVHDATIANIFFQEFTERFKHGIIIVDKPECQNDYHTIKQDSILATDVTENDNIPGEVNLTVTRDPSHGTAAADGTIITYDPDNDFTGLDTIAYKVCLTDNDALCDSALVVIYVTQATGMKDLPASAAIVFPNPSTGRFTVTATVPVTGIRIYSLAGRLLQNISSRESTIMEVNSGLPAGLYLIEIKTQKGTIRRKIQIQ